MSEQALDLRRSMRILRRHKFVVGIATVLGISGGVALAVVTPPTFTSRALVVLPTTAAKYIATQVVIGGSDPVLGKAASELDPPTTLQGLQSRIQVKSLAPTIISISAQGKSAAQAEQAANVVATSYVDYLGSAKNPGL